MFKPSGPIGHCSTRLRKLLEIEEKVAHGVTVRIKDVAADNAPSSTGGGSRWTRKANFAVPGPFHTRPVAAGGSVSFHFSMATVSKSQEGRSVISTAGEKPVETDRTAADNVTYITREGAVETIDPSAYAAYTGRDGAVEQLVGDILAHFTNIHENPAIRKGYWQKVHQCERTRGPDRLVLHPDRLPRMAWKRIAQLPELPTEVNKIAAEFAAASGADRKAKPRAVSLPVEQGKMVIKAIRDTGEIWSRKKPPVRIAEGRGGRTQYRFVAELPAGLDAAARVRIVSGFCNHFAETGVMYEAVIHRPDAHNDARNYHLHLSVHDRPARLIGDRWDFEIAEPVEGQSGRVHYPYRQPKVAGFVRAPDGTDHRAYAAARVRELRARFADLCNEELAAIGSTLRFDPRRLEEMGIDRKATKPLGTRAAPLEAAGVPTRVGIANAEIIWNYELQEAARRAQVQAGDRRLLQKRLITALEGAEKAGDAAAVALLKNDIATLVDQSAVLDAHQADLAEYETTLTMARARPDKTAATCRAILQTVADGTASRSDRKAAQAIRVRLNEATAFLAQIDRIVSRDAELVAMTQHAAQAAEQDVQAIGERLVAFGNRARPQVEFKQAGPSAPASANTTAAPSSNRNTVEALLKRVLADDMSILLPDAKNPKFRVPGISRDELRVVVHPTWDEAVQNGLREISAIQVKRMHSAADYVAAMGMESLQRNAQMNGDARHALKHATAYWDHPVFQERLRQRSAALAPTDSSMEAGRSNPVGGLFRRLADSLDGLFALRPASAPDESDQVPALPPTPASVQPAAANEPTEIIDPRQTAINDLAEALIKDHRLRVEMTGGRLTIVPTEEGWERSIDAFSDEPAVQKAMRKRHVSPWLDVPHSERAATIDSIRDALRSPDRRPIARGATGWLLSGLPEHMAQQIRQWNGYDELEAILRKADNYWTSREEWRDRHPTALPDRRAPETSAKGLQRASVLPQPSVGLDQDLRDQHWIEWQRGQSR